MVKRWLLTLASAGAVAVTLAVSTGSASASTNVITAINHENKVILVSKSLARTEKLLKGGDKDPTKLWHAFDTLAAKYERAATYVSHSSADSTRQSEGRHDWVGGVRDIGGALYKLGRAFHELAEGNAAHTQQLVASADKRVQAGEKLGEKATRLLNTSF